jgi:hypothetical protein
MIRLVGPATTAGICRHVMAGYGTRTATDSHSSIPDPRRRAELMRRGAIGRIGRANLNAPDRLEVCP